ncbi:uncharacterized protein L3040_002256 [Drepanopeziza brunnea f. sp. 'multigermtubi']|uniref:Uncharacterized protein n=1 Tax=Marssonina brunnea f. sp. multigermtubi (strain MB_m1) TaxID=1072389 RepID=K1X4F8_MARBU|nr:uncharacterized protein MBM_02018 [Drepanopeziza brunnea f. sp. 'multigermtubi' MB_m1]EKD20066.1 hypothetical protein MBM_02018 [Drepanopeziza brunnea f. sp. 'multigermtubi' MB_m1]KAJ5050373.1 hypothetical protein L3040_002256 [Drepanopeziza brunnea f. sp. 'multigermtubi']
MGFFHDIGALLAGTAAALDHFGQHQLGPAMGEAAKALDSFGEDVLGPAMSEAGKALDTFGKEKLGPAVGEVGKALDTFGKEKLGPAMAVTGQALDTFGKEKLGPAMDQTGKALDVFGKEKLGPAMELTGDLIKKNPGAAAAIAASGLTFVAPFLVTGPLLWVFGWGGTGIRAGSAAAAIQASAGNVVAGTTFATLQSAAMGGYGAAAVNGVVMICSAVTGTISGITGFGNRTETKTEVKDPFGSDSDTDTDTEEYGATSE